MSKALLCTPFEEIDICTGIGGQANGIYVRYYLDYPPLPIERDTDISQVIISNLRDIQRKVFLQSGTQLVIKGRTRSGEKSRILGCTHSVMTDQSKCMLDNHDDMYRFDSMVNSDKCGRRKNGRQLPRRIAVSNRVCGMSFTIKWDDCGRLYIQLQYNAGCPFHTGHAKEDPELLQMASRLLSDEEREQICGVADSSTCDAVARNHALKQCDIRLTCS